MWQPTRRGIQSVIFLSRWLVAPFLLGLIFCILLIIYRFFADLYTLAIKVPTMGWHDLLVDELNLIDLTLTANLVLIVIFSGYENYIRKVDPAEHRDWPDGLVDVNFSVLKQKLLDARKAELDAAVQAGRLTAEQRDQIVARMTANIDRMLDMTPGQRGPQGAPGQGR